MSSLNDSEVHGRGPNSYPRERGAIVHGPSSRALTGIGIFLFFGAGMASLAGTTLLWRGTVLKRMWMLNPGPYKQLVPLGPAAGISFFFLCTALGAGRVQMCS